MKIDLDTRRKARIDMLPLIDIVFLLLVFFIYAMLSMTVHHAIPVALPVSTTAPLDRQVDLSVSIDRSGAIYVDKVAATLEELSGILRSRVDAADKPPGVLLFADNQIAYQTLYEVIDRIKLAGIQRLSLECERRP